MQRKHVFGLYDLLLIAKQLFEEQDQDFLLAADWVHKHLATYAQVLHLIELALLDLLLHPVGLGVVALLFEDVFPADVYGI